MKSQINTFIALLLIVISPSLNAQEIINFEQALNLMDKSNILTNSHKTSYEIVEQNLKTYKVISKAGVSTEIGQVNSALFDSKISLSQNLAWPTIHKAQKEFLVAEKNKTVSTNEVSLFKLKKYLTEYFIIFHHNNLLRKVNDAKIILLEKLLAISDLRNKSGVENAVNSLALKSQLIQLKSSEKDLALQQNICEENVNLILNNTSNMKIFADEIFDLSTYAKLRVVLNPLLKLSEQEVELAKAIKKVEASKLLPDIVLGINNTSFRGVGPDNKTYNASNRFTSAQVGILLPIFDKSQKMKVKVSELNVNLAEEEKQIVHKTLEMQNRVNELKLASIIEKINLIKESINLIDQSISIATKEYELGEVTFAEISNLLDQKNQLEMLKIEAWLAKNTLALNNIFQTLN